MMRETYGVLRAIKLWQHGMRGQRIVLKLDNVIALGIAHQLCSLSMPLNKLLYLASELALQLEMLDVPGIEVFHLLGQFGTEVAWLSRVDERGPGPQSLKGRPVKRIVANQWIRAAPAECLGFAVSPSASGKRGCAVGSGRGGGMRKSLN